MPIDYSKFDRICDDEDDEEDERRGLDAGGGDFTQLMQCLQQLGEERGGGVPPPPQVGGIDIRPPVPPPVDPFFDEYDPEGSTQPLDMEGLRAEAWQLLVSRLVTRPGAAGVQRALLLEAEMHLLGSRYRQALVAALALQMAGDAGGAVSHGLTGGRWAASAAVVEMVSSYQLGDRARAMVLRDTLRQADRSMLSKHLEKRFHGTSEVLALVPEFLNILKAAERDEHGSEAIGSSRL
mmetsp:Transcript_105734/g.315832  ORF Transcript_105734/g.315832 Transcript_105734/m.315832 type:complete len:237 (+) Transcript_105734:88-798(+)